MKRRIVTFILVLLPCVQVGIAKAGVSLKIAVNEAPLLEFTALNNYSLLLGPRYEINRSTGPFEDFSLWSLLVGGRYNFERVEQSQLFAEITAFGFWLKNEENTERKIADNLIYVPSIGLRHYLGDKVSIEGKIGAYVRFSESSVTGVKFVRSGIPVSNIYMNYHF
ncbi:MAG: hypothetical protein OEZ43_21450 [Gammaproteobacteria bacterium]|nr:hypothetical protein [Gammaproteobacteria bacterium]